VPSWRSNLVRKSEARRHTRHPLEGALRVLWQDESGRERVSQGKLVDVSESGIRFRTDDRIPVRTMLTCNDAKLGICGRGAVRHCNFVKGKYELGIEFSGGTGFREGEERRAPKSYD
jgi:hypothetical protein